MKKSILVLSVYFFITSTQWAQKDYNSNDSLSYDHKLNNFVNTKESDTLTEFNKETKFRRWQFKIGYSLNNKYISNAEITTNFDLSRTFMFSLDLRLYSFISLSGGLMTHLIPVSDNFSLALKGGISFIGFPIPIPALPSFDLSLEYGFLLRYKISPQYNLILEFEQIKVTSKYVKSFTSLSGSEVNHFPVAFLSAGIEF